MSRTGLILSLLMVSLAVPRGAAAMTDSASLPLRSAAPDLVLTGEVGPQDNLSFRDVPFVVPRGVVRVSVDFDYDERDKYTVIDLAVSDPYGSRGSSGSNKASFTLSRTDATPAYLPGEIVPGTWKLNLAISAIRPNVHAHYTAKIWFWRHGDVAAVSTFSPEPLKTGAHWWRGDLHMHTAHSDGSCPNATGQAIPCPLYRTAEAAVTHGLDFIAISDHNTGSQFDAIRELQPAFDTLLMIPAAEVTTFQGHFNAFGSTERLDPRLGSPSAPTINAILNRAEDLHALVSINHPTSPTDETCRGCGWSPPNTDWSKVQAIEALNAGEIFAPLLGEHLSRPGTAFWRDLLNRGYRLTGVGGSDNHDIELGRLGVGFPTTVVYAPELSERAILDAIRAGHVFIDVLGSRDAILEMEASTLSARAMMGDVLAAPVGTRVTLTLHVSHLKGGRLAVEQDGAPLSLSDPDLTSNDEIRRLQIIGDGKPHWIRADVKSGPLPALIGNPIYLNRNAETSSKAQ